jgi:anti-sigma factor RsiW
MTRIDDADLIAYLDGILPAAQRQRIDRALAEDEELANRFVVLLDGDRPFHAAFVPLLDQAPTDRLAAMLTGLAVSPAARSEPEPERRRKLSVAGNARRIAAGLAFLAVGIGAGIAIDRVGFGAQAVGEAAEWRQVVAEYLTLYTPDTLTRSPEDADARARELTAVGTKLGLPLAPAGIDLPGPVFQWALLLAYDGKPLGQIAYLDPESGPMALCIIADGANAATFHAERRQGLGIVSWSRDGRSFMVIGRAPMPRLQGYAEILAGRLS